MAYPSRFSVADLLALVGPGVAPAPTRARIFLTAGAAPAGRARRSRERSTCTQAPSSACGAVPWRGGWARRRCASGWTEPTSERRSGGRRRTSSSWPAPRRPPAAPARRPAGVAGDRRGGLQQDGLPDDQNNDRKPHPSERCCPAPTADPALVCRMEDVLDVDDCLHDPARPVVCPDGTDCRLLADARALLPSAPGRAARHDPGYVRGRVLNLFLMTEPLRGRRDVLASERRTRPDSAHVVRLLASISSPEAERIAPDGHPANFHPSISNSLR